MITTLNCFMVGYVWYIITKSWICSLFWISSPTGAVLMLLSVVSIVLIVLEVLCSDASFYWICCSCYLCYSKGFLNSFKPFFLWTLILHGTEKIDVSPRWYTMEIIKIQELFDAQWWSTLIFKVTVTVLYLWCDDLFPIKCHPFIIFQYVVRFIILNNSYYCNIFFFWNSRSNDIRNQVNWLQECMHKGWRNIN